MNSSFFICEKVLNLVNFITIFILDLGSSLFGKDINFLSLINTINSSLTINAESLNVFSIDGIIKTIVSFGIFNLLLSYSLRYVMIKIMVLLCPFSFLCLIDKSTESFFKSWIKSLFSLLVLQILVSIILILPHAINIELSQSSSDLFNKLTLVGTIYALFKANDFIKELVGGLSTNVDLGISNIKTLLTKM